jgi:3-hydroxyisobutyrate dehydrogenase-like beta-hydroxyacid dehydrogenase
MPRKSRKNVGLIGLGIIGSRVAAGLRASGYQVFVWNRTPRPTPNFLGSPAEIAEICDVIQLFVADAHAVREVIEMCGETLDSRHTIICCATIGPEATRQIADGLRSRGVQFLDAPFTGSKLAAEKAQLCYYVGGDEAVYQRVRPVLEATSRAIVRCGGIGDASTLKVATNLITAATTQVLAEALAIVKKAGVAPETLGLALEHNACKSGVIELKLPKMVAGDYEPHFSLKHMFKDVQIGIHMANALGLEIPVTTVTAGVMYGALNHGWADLDFASLYKVYSEGVPERAPMALPAAPAPAQPVAPMLEAQFTEEKPAPAELTPIAAAKVVEPPKTEVFEIVQKPTGPEAKPAEPAMKVASADPKPAEPAPKRVEAETKLPEFEFKPVDKKPAEPKQGQPPIDEAKPAQAPPPEPPRTELMEPPKVIQAPAPTEIAPLVRVERIEPTKVKLGEPPKMEVAEPPKPAATEPPKAGIVELPKVGVAELPKAGAVEPPKAEVAELPKVGVAELPKTEAAPAADSAKPAELPAEGARVPEENGEATNGTETPKFRPMQRLRRFFRSSST